MKRDTKIMLATIMVGAVTLGSLTYTYYKSSKSSSEEAISNVFNTPLEEGEPFIGNGRSESNNVLNLEDVKELAVPKTADVVRNSSQKLTDADISKLWFDVRDKEQSLSSRRVSWEKLIAGIEGLMREDKTPQIVEKFPAVIASRTDFGFYEDYHSFPNGNVTVTTMVGPDILEDKLRTVFFTKVVVGSSVKVNTFKAIDMVPVSFALDSSGSGNFLTMAGVGLNEKMFTDQEDGRLAVFAVNGDGLSTVPIEEGQSMSGTSYSVNSNNILTFTNFEKSPVIFTDVAGDDQIPKYLLVTTRSKESQTTYTITMEKGKPIIRAD